MRCRNAVRCGRNGQLESHLTCPYTHAHHFSPRVVGQLACRLWKSRLRSELRL